MGQMPGQWPTSGSSPNHLVVFAEKRKDYRPPRYRFDTKAKDPARRGSRRFIISTSSSLHSLAVVRSPPSDAKAAAIHPAPAPAPKSKRLLANEPVSRRTSSSQIEDTRGPSASSSAHSAGTFGDVRTLLSGLFSEYAVTKRVLLGTKIEK